MKSAKEQFDIMKNLKWIAKVGVNVKRELREDSNFAFKSPGDCYVECWKCGMFLYFDGIGDGEVCPNCGFDGWIEHGGCGGYAGPAYKWPGQKNLG